MHRRLVGRMGTTCASCWMAYSAMPLRYTEEIQHPAYTVLIKQSHKAGIKRPEPKEIRWSIDQNGSASRAKIAAAASFPAATAFISVAGPVTASPPA